MKKILSLIMVLGLLLSGCGGLKPVDQPGGNSSASQNGSGTTDSTSAQVEVELNATDADMFTDRDVKTDYRESESVVISLEGDRASCGASSVVIDGSHITITGDETYILRGTLNDGTVTVAAENEKPRLVLEGVSITSSDNAPLRIQEADKVFITLAENTENYLINGGSFSAGESEGVDGAVFSRQDLTLNGSGSLTVTSPAGHGIVCKDDLVFTGGSYTIESAAHGLDANDSVRIRDAVLTVDAGKDGIHSEETEDASLGFVYISGGTVKLEAEGDGISAEAYLQITDGTIEILAGGGYENGASHSSGGWGDFMGGGMGGMGPGRRSVSESTGTAEDGSTSMKGMKAAGALLIAGGTVTVDSADDGIHSNASVTIAGGSIQIASGDDGVHADTTLLISAGTVNISQSYEGLEAKDILIKDGDISLVASDDGLNASGGTDSSGTGGRDQMFGGMGGGMSGSSDGSIVIDGGKLYVQSSGDGMDANGYLEINDGYVVICGPNSGDTATLDYDISGTINGGTFIGTGASGMAQTFSDNAQGVLAVSVGMGQSAGVKITVSDPDGNALVSYEPELAFSVIIFSTPDMVSGQTYHVTVGNAEGDIEAY